MKISLAILLVFGLVAVIAAVPTQDEPKVEQPNLEEQDVPEGEKLDDNDDEFTEGNDEVEEEEDDDEGMNLDLQDVPMNEEDPEQFEEVSDPKKPAKRPPHVCKRPFKLKFGCYRKKCYKCCTHCRVGYVHCNKARRACRFHRLCGRIGKRLHCVFVRTCHRIDVRCRYIGSCFSRNCRRVVRKSKKPKKP